MGIWGQRSGRRETARADVGEGMLRGCSSVETEEVCVRPETIRKALRGCAEGWCRFKCVGGSQAEKGVSP